MSRAASTRRGSAASASVPASRMDYFSLSELPYHSLLFVLPLIVIYELGTQYVTPGSRIIAYAKLQEFFFLLGATGRWLPALSVVGILLTWHIARKDSWEVRGGTLGGMLVESVMLSLPLIAIGFLLSRYLPYIPLAGLRHWQGTAIASLGAGVYEELVFRLIALTILSLLLVDLLKMPKIWAVPLMVLISSILFSLYHYWESEPFQWQTFAFRTVAGIYFGVIFINRGFGITAGCHAAYDVIAITLPILLQR